MAKPELCDCNARFGIYREDTANLLKRERLLQSCIRCFSSLEPIWAVSFLSTHNNAKLQDVRRNGSASKGTIVVIEIKAKGR